MKRELKNINNLSMSLVIPCYGEEKYIRDTLAEVKKVLSKITNRYEIICVVDGLVDGTYEIIKKETRTDKEHLKAVGYIKNRGKGFALRVGLEMAKGDICGFIDADGQIAPEAIKEAVDLLIKNKLDIVVGSKAHKDSNVSYTPFRSMISKVSQLYIRTLFNVDVSDTQAGLKVFRSKVIKPILPRLIVDRFGFDIEFLAVSKYLGFDKVGEVPIRVKMLREDNIGTNLVLFIKDVFRTYLDLGPIFYRLRTGYYSIKNKDHWTKTVKPKLLIS